VALALGEPAEGAETAGVGLAKRRLMLDQIADGGEQAVVLDQAGDGFRFGFGCHVIFLFVYINIRRLYIKQAISALKKTRKS